MAAAVEQRPPQQQQFGFPLSESPTKGMPRQSAIHIPSTFTNTSTPSSPAPSPQKKPADKHPYAIRTTAGGILSRSNSITSDHAKHHYMPPSPSPSPAAEFINHGAGGGKGADDGKDKFRGHRYSRSLSSTSEYAPSSDGPRALPSPPTSMIRSQTTGGMHSHKAQPVVDISDLPPNPKEWWPNQLATYLGVRLTSSGDIPPRVVEDIQMYIRTERINGREFIRLAQDGNPLVKEVPQPYRAPLVHAAKALRGEVMKGLIWGADEDDSPPGTLSGAPNITTDPESLYASGGSSSSLDLSEQPQESKIAGRFRNGRVQGMVKTYERSGSSESGSDNEQQPDGLPQASALDAPPARSDSFSSDVVPTGSMKRILPAPPPLPSGFVNPGVDSNYSILAAGTGRPLPTPPPSNPSHSNSGSQDEGMGGIMGSAFPTPPLHIPIVVKSKGASDDEKSMTELLRANGILPDKTRVAKRRAKDAKARYGAEQEYLSSSEEDSSSAKKEKEGSGSNKKKKRGGVHAWLDVQDGVGPEGATVKRVPDAAAAEGEGSGKVISVGSGDWKTAKEIFALDAADVEQLANVAAKEEAEAEKRDREMERLRNALAETQKVAEMLKNRVDEVEGRVVGMNVLGEEVKAHVESASASPGVIPDEDEEKEKKRVEEVEKQVKALSEALKDKDAKISELQSELASAASSVSPTPDPSKANAVAAPSPKSLVSKLTAAFGFSTSSAPKKREEGKREEQWRRLEEGLRVRELPGYVVLVGLGVCVVCLKVIGRRAVRR